MILVLIRPSEYLKEEALSFKQDFLDNKEEIINGSELLDQMDNYDEWLSMVTANTNTKTVDSNWVVTDTFFAVDSNKKIVGIIDLRHTLNDFLKDIGNCGYSVRPSERRKGYATEMLRQVLDIARSYGMKELHLSAKKDNEASIKTIVKNGGVYERSFVFDNTPADIYRIDL